MNYSMVGQETYLADATRLEAITTCVGFDDLLDVTLGGNHPHLDTMIVVTSHSDQKTQQVCRKYGAICVQTDLFHKNQRGFNKGAAINAGFNRFQHHGWRLHLDADIILPDNFRRVLFNHSHLDRSCLYGADRVDVVGRGELKDLAAKVNQVPQHCWSVWIDPSTGHGRQIGHRYVDTLSGYVPPGFFQLWHASQQKDYPWSLGDATHDDIAFAMQWAGEHRRLLPTALCYHLCAAPPELGQNWDGKRRQPRL
jgi:glycosyltransferase involved in cell wall biosynthesis